MMITSASALYRQAAKLAPATTLSTEQDSHCAMCGAFLPAGTGANPILKDTFGDSFNNKQDLRARTGKYVCGDCEVLWSKLWLQNHSKTFATSGNVYKFASNEQQAAFLLNPPPPPFAAIFSTRQQQHMIWRTPVSHSREVFFVRVDGDLLTIRHTKLLEAYRAYKHAESVMANHKHPRTKRKINPPAALFSRELASGHLGQIRTDVQELLEHVGDHWVMEVMDSLTMGEWWALGAIRHYSPDSPPNWQPADLTGEAKTDGDGDGADEAETA